MSFELLPEVKQQMQLWQSWRSPQAKPVYAYQDLPPSDRLRYELMTWHNCHLMLKLFEHDPNPFVVKSLKSRPEFDHYLADVLGYRYYSGKRGACDWFLSLIGGEYVGVLHLYDLNREVYQGKHLPPFMGYAIAAAHRGRGYAEEAARHLMGQLPLIFERYEVLAEPKLQNEASRNLLLKLGFVEQRKIPKEKSSIWYKKLIEGTVPGAN